MHVPLSVLYKDRMKLEAYLNKTHQSIEDFAQEAGISAQAIYKYLRGERLPRKEFLNRLAAVTNGEVTANDFLDLPQPSTSQEKKHL